MAEHKVCQVQDVAPGAALRVELADIPIAVVRESNGDFHAIGDTCSHAEISLSEGEVEGNAIECWAHGSRFDLNTGEPLSLPAYDPVPVFGLRVDGDDIYVDPEQVSNNVDPYNYVS